MTEINKRIIELIGENKGIKEISNILGITEKQLYVRIKQIINYGYLLTPSYSYDSNIYYKLENEFKDINENEISIKLPSSNKDFRSLVISDMHIGNVDSDIKLLDIVYDYAINNNINTIFICGDVIEGIHTSDKRNIHGTEEQVETFIKRYPYDKNINNFCLFGNHDYHSIHYEGIDISKRITSARYDIISAGYGEGLIKIKDDGLLLKHELSVVENPNLTVNPKVVLVGHGHKMKTKIYDRLYLCVPTLSNVSPDKTKEVIPGFLDMTVHFDKGRFEFVEAHHMIITPKVYEASVSRCRIKKIFNNYNNK